MELNCQRRVGMEITGLTIFCWQGLILIDIIYFSRWVNQAKIRILLQLTARLLAQSCLESSLAQSNAIVANHIGDADLEIGIGVYHVSKVNRILGLDEVVESFERAPNGYHKFYYESSGSTSTAAKSKVYRSEIDWKIKLRQLWYMLVFQIYSLSLSQIEMFYHSYNKFKIAMKRILNYFNDLQLDQKTQSIINGNLAQNVVEQRAEEIQSLEQKERILYMSKLNERIKQITKPYKALSVLVLVDEMMRRGLLSCLPHMEFRQLQERMEVEQVVLTNILKYYHYFLQMNNCSYYNKQTLNQENELYEAEYYCRISILKLLEFLKIEFVFTHAWAKLTRHRLLLRAIIQSILQRFAEDLKILSLFIANNQDIMLQKTVAHPLLFQIYNSYQKLIFINKNLRRIEKLGRMAHCEQEFAVYEVDADLNKEIELAVLERREEMKVSGQNGDGFGRKMEEGECFDEQAVKTTESFLLLNDSQQYS